MTHTEPLAPGGLSQAEAARRLQSEGPNALARPEPKPWLELAKRLWGPVPWMLEAALVLELALGRFTQAGIIGGLLLMNALVSFFQQRKADQALALLGQKLTVTARVQRGGQWETRPSSELVRGDWVHLRVGDLIPADIQLSSGHLLVDASSLTGESLPVERESGASVFAGATVARGEADGSVVATGPRTRFGRTAQLLQTGGPPGHIDRVVLSVVRALVAVDLVLVGAVIAYAVAHRMDPKEVIPYCLILLVASVPVALPATFSLSLALGARELAQQGVLVTRLAALEDVAAMDVLCTDKTGTLTRNELEVAGCVPLGATGKDDLLRFAALASDASTQDPIDLALLRAAGRTASPAPPAERLEFIPFDPSTKRSEASVRIAGEVVRVVKGTPQAVTALAGAPSEALEGAVESLGAQGQRVLAIAAGPEGHFQLLGAVGLMDRPREESAALVGALREKGVRIVMATGDALATAKTIAREVGITGAARGGVATDDATLLSTEVFAGVYPEDKHRLVQSYQQHRHVVGMTGDGVNDAPALKQAEVGIAVSNAVDVAKAAASMVLTAPGLTPILAAIDSGRRVFQRMSTYTLNKIVKTLQVSVYLTVGLLWTGEMVITPRLILLLLFANDFVTMSLSADTAEAAPRPATWDMRKLVGAASALAAWWLVFSFGALFVARDFLHLPLKQVQTFSFIVLVFTGQASVYALRTTGPFWSRRPGPALLASTIGDLIAVALLAATGTAMGALPISLLAVLAAATLAGLVIADVVKRLTLRAS